MKFKEFEKQLRLSLIEELEIHIPKLENIPISSFDLGVHPWYGYFELSFLTSNEVLLNKEKFKYDIAAWKYYNINEFQSSDSSKLYHLGLFMQDKFERIQSFQYDRFFRISAQIINSKEIQGILDSYVTTPDFYCSVYDPDDLKFRNYCKGFRKGWIKNIGIFRFFDIIKELNE